MTISYGEERFSATQSANGDIVVTGDAVLLESEASRERQSAPRSR